MNTPYDSILIPVDESLDTQKAVGKAIELSIPWRTTIHLVQLIKSWKNLRISRHSDDFKKMLDGDLDEYIAKLIDVMHWKDHIDNKCHGIAVHIHLRPGPSLQSLVIHTTQKQRTGLIIIASNSIGKSQLIGNRISASQLAHKTGCNILSMKTDSFSGFTEEIETLFKPLFNGNGKIGNSSLTGLALDTLHKLFSRN